MSKAQELEGMEVTREHEAEVGRQPRPRGGLESGVGIGEASRLIRPLCPAHPPERMMHQQPGLLRGGEVLQRRELCRIGRNLLTRGPVILSIGRVQNQQLHISQGNPIGGGIVLTRWRPTMRIEEAKPRFACTSTALMVTTGQHPGHCPQQWACRLKEIRSPGIPVITPGTASTLGTPGWAGRLAIEIVPD